MITSLDVDRDTPLNNQPGANTSIASNATTGDSGRYSEGGSMWAVTRPLLASLSWVLLAWVMVHYRVVWSMGKISLTYYILEIHTHQYDR